MFTGKTKEQIAEIEKFENTPVGQLTVREFRELMRSVFVQEERDKQRRKLEAEMANPYQRSRLSPSGLF